jgi:hypothetical protein
MGKRTRHLYWTTWIDVLVVACGTVQAAGVGVSSPVITVPDAQRGVEYERVITVSNTADDDGAFDFNAT